MIAPIDYMRPWHEWPIVVWDFETTGPDPETCQPVQVGAARFEGGELVKASCALINPGCPIPAESTAVHGITDEMVADAERGAVAVVAQIAREVRPSRAMQCAYNAPFDHRVMVRTMSGLPDQHGEPFVPDDLPWLDPLIMVRTADKFAPGSKRHSLEKACERRGITIEKAHDALADATATGLLLFEMADMLGDLTMPEVLRRQAVRAAEQEAEFEEYRAKLVMQGDLAKRAAKLFDESGPEACRDYLARVQASAEKGE